MSGIANHDTGVIYEFQGPQAHETSDQKDVKFPITSMLTPAYAAAIELEPEFKKTIVEVTATGAITWTADVTKAKVGDELIVRVTASGGARVSTFSTGFVANGTLNAATSALTVISFVFNGTAFIEVSRVETPA